MLRLHFSIFYVKITDIFVVATIVTRMPFGIVFVGKLQNGDSNLGCISEKKWYLCSPLIRFAVSWDCFQTDTHYYI